MPLLPTHLRTVSSHRSALAVAARGRQQQWRHPIGALRTGSWRMRRAAALPRGNGVGWTPLERLMRRGAQVAQAVAHRRAGAVTYQHHTHWSLTLAPQFVQRVQRHTTSLRMAAMRRPATVELRPVLRTLAAAGAHGAKRAAVVSATPQVTAVHARPSAAHTVLRQAASRHAVAATPFARLPLTLVHNAAAVSSASQRPPQAAAATDVNAVQRSPQPAPWPLASAPTPPLPAQEVQRLTDHVMAQLDRRALSWRERTQA
jgi:hypothetical protein